MCAILKQANPLSKCIDKPTVLGRPDLYAWRVAGGGEDDERHRVELQSVRAVQLSLEKGQ